jgi:hypothetical protein
MTSAVADILQLRFSAEKILIRQNAHGLAAPELTLPWRSMLKPALLLRSGGENLPKIQRVQMGLQDSQRRFGWGRGCRRRRGAAHDVGVAVDDALPIEGFLDGHDCGPEWWLG